MCLQTSPSTTKVQTAKKVGKYVVGSKIGTGSFGNVHVGIDTSTGEKVAIKVCNNHLYKEKKMFTDLENELRTLNEAQGCNSILGLRDTLQTQNNTYIVMDLCSSTLLEEIMTAEKFDTSKAKFRLRELIVAVNHLHSVGIVHRDIKPENVLLSKNNESKLGDFGFARFSDDRSIVAGAGTAEYLAPEAFVARKNKNIDIDYAASDIWACGVVFYAMLTGRLPYTREQVKSWKSFSEVRFPSSLLSNIDPLAVDLLKAMMNPIASKRLTAAEVLKHPFLRSTSPVRASIHKIGKQLSKALGAMKTSKSN